MKQAGGGQTALPESKNTGKEIKEDIVIHTMQDDIALAKKAKASSGRNNTPIQNNAPVVDKVSSRDKGQQNTIKAFPLPPKPPSSKGSHKVVLPPVKRPRQKTKKSLAIVAKAFVFMLIFASLAGAGVAAWVFLGPDGLLRQPDRSLREFIDIEDFIPQTVLAVASYKIEDANDKSNIINAWETASEEASSLAALLAGDPRYLLERADVDEFHYLILEGDPSPFLIIPNNQDTAELVDSMSIGSALEKNTWYVLHAIDTDLYEEEVAKGLLVDSTMKTEGFTLLNDKINLVIGPDMLLKIREGWGRASFAGGLMQSIFAQGSFANEGTALRMEGYADYEADGRTGNDNAEQRLLEAIPSDIHVVRLGSNFSADLNIWQENSNLLNRDILSKPSVNQFLSELSTPYAYFLRERNDGLDEIGIVITIPESLKNELTLGHASIEESLPAILPLIVEEEPATTAFTFNDNTHNGVLLRYINFAGPNRAIDYTIIDDYILIATSKEGMFTLVDTVINNKPALNQADNWQRLFETWGALPSTKDIVIGRLNNSPLSSLLPVDSIRNEIQFGFNVQASDADRADLKGLLLLSNRFVHAAREPRGDSIFSDDNDTDNHFEHIVFE